MYGRRWRTNDGTENWRTSERKGGRGYRNKRGSGKGSTVQWVVGGGVRRHGVTEVCD